MKNVLQIVDNIPYIRTNCYQHQLLQGLQCQSNLTTVTYHDILSGQLAKKIDESDVVLSTLKLRTLERIRFELATSLNRRKIVVYEQDAFENFRDDGAYKNSYDRINDELNVDYYVVTVKSYADLLNEKGFTCKFERIWMLPQFCIEPTLYDNRRIPISFMGTMYPWRQRLMDDVKAKGIKVSIERNSHTYFQYLDMLRDVKIFLCSHDSKLVIDGIVQEHRHGMYHKDVEVASRGCFSISEWSPECSTYIDEKRMRAIKLFKDTSEIPEIIQSIEKMDSIERQNIIIETINCIKDKNCWKSTVNTLLGD